MPGEDQVEPRRVLEVRRSAARPVTAEESQRQAGAAQRASVLSQDSRPASMSRHRDQQTAGREALGPRVQADPPAPRRLVAARHSTAAPRRWSRAGPGDREARPGVPSPPWVAQANRPAVGTAGARAGPGSPGARPCRRPRAGCPSPAAAPATAPALHESGDLRRQGRSGRRPGSPRSGRRSTQAGSSPMSSRCAQKLHFSAALIVRVDEDRVVRAGRDARLAPDAGPLVEVDDAVGPPVHRLRRARGNARRVRALIAPGHLEDARVPAGRRPPRPTSRRSGSPRGAPRSRSCTRWCRRGSRCTGPGQAV